jgi:hypothetical protein
LAVGRICVFDGLPAPADLSLGGLGQSRQQTQQAGFAGAVFTTHVQPLACIDCKIEPGEQATVAAHASQPMCTQYETKMEVNLDGTHLR